MRIISDTAPEDGGRTACLAAGGESLGDTNALLLVFDRLPACLFLLFLLLALSLSGGL